MHANRIAKALFLCSIVCSPLFPATIDNVSISLNGINLAIDGVAQANASRTGDTISFSISNPDNFTGNVSGTVDFSDGNLLKLDNFFANCTDTEEGCINPFLLLITATGNDYTGTQQFGLRLTDSVVNGSMTTGCLAASVSMGSLLTPPACNTFVPTGDSPSGVIAVDLVPSGLPATADFELQDVFLQNPAGDPVYMSLALGWAQLGVESSIAIGANSADLLATPQPTEDVPEPGTVALLGIGLVCLGVARRKIAN